jgi:DNA helicase-2/ATP-dependent DNA helicase PcrA
MKLNPAQKEAVETIEGPVMVIAGPGTGKTQIIAERIANILKKTDAEPVAILALTFTESGAKAMKERLITTIGEAAYYVNISTFHAFCSSVIQERPDRFSSAAAAEPLADLERVGIFEEILKKGGFNYLKPANSPFFYTPYLIKAIQALKREGVDPEKFKEILAQAPEKTKEDKYQLKKNQELLKIYSLYQKALAERSRYDFEDMINLVADAFTKDKDLLLTYQERLHYFLIDEYQDTNSSQNQVLKLLAAYWGQEANVFAVGDPNQSIYRFQGASLENALEFTKVYPKAKIVVLEQNYRSHQLILDAAYELIAKNKLKIEDVVKTAKAKLKAQSGLKTAPLQVIKLPGETVEAYWVGQKITKLINSGTKPEEIAVLYRHNQDAEVFADMLVKLGVPVEIEGGANVLADPVINQLLVFLKAIDLTSQKLEDLELFTLMHYPWFKLDALAVLKLARQASQAKKSMADLILEGKAEEQFSQFINQLAQWQELDSRKNFSEWLETLIKKSGFLDWILSRPDAVSLLNRLNSLFSEVKKLNSADHNLNLHKFLEALKLMEFNRLTIAEQDLDIKSRAVSLSTCHKAKGREWEQVFIVKVVDGKWGNHQTREMIKLPPGILVSSEQIKKEKNEDERRLFYVALTRAKKQVYLTSSERYLAGNYLKEAVSAMFLTEIPKKYQEVSQPRLTGEAEKVLRSWLEPAKIPQPTVAETGWLKTLINDFRLSATALNTYLTCPYKFKLNVLVRVPRAKAGYFAFGSAVHKALELFHRKFIADDKHPGKEYLLQQFEIAIKNEVLTDEELERRLKQGKQILSAYYDYYHDDLIKPLLVEKFFGYGWSKVFLEDIPLTGKIDRIDLIDQSAKTIRVVDYKTGQAKTRNQILGETREANKDYLRQLVFYKLLTGLDRQFPLKVKETVLDFVEPNKKSGKFKQEKFIVTDEQVKELKDTIRSVMKDIRALNFSRTTDFRHCPTCEFRPHCWPEGLPQSEQLKLV